MRPRVQLIAKPQPGITGISRYAQDLYAGLQASGLDVRLTFPVQAPLPECLQRGLRRVGLDVRAFFANYPLQARVGTADIYHLTGQMLATLLLFKRFPKPVVVSVLDIIPYLVRHDPELDTFCHPMDYLFYRLALAGLRRADTLIAISEYTKRTLVEALCLPEDRIHVVYPAVDHNRFRPLDVPDAFRSKHGLDQGERYVLFVGYEDPRKNLSGLLRAFALVKQQVPRVKLLKVGPSHGIRERQKLLVLIEELDLQHDVRFFDYVSDEELLCFYNAADVFVMPSLYEGFGLPLVEAMACAKPVVLARAGSLPEVADGIGIEVHPRDVLGLANAVSTLLQDPDERLRLGREGYRRAATFTWQRAVHGMEKIYTDLLEQSWTAISAI